MVASHGADRQPFRMPGQCPVCGGHVVREEGEAASRCVNTDCPARLKESILHFASRGVMDIDGMGDVLVDQLVDRGLVIPAVVRGRLIEPRGGGKAGSEAGLGIAIAASAEGSPAADGELVDLRRSLT